jgi:hypothetical protein
MVIVWDVLIGRICAIVTVCITRKAVATVEVVLVEHVSVIIITTITTITTITITIMIIIK